MIPSRAKRVFKAKIFDVYQWRQKMFDGSYETFEFVQRPDTVIVLATVKNKLVILKQKQPNTNWYYSSPAGRMDVPGETPKQAALRELLEETGMRPEKIIHWKTIKHRGKIRQNVYFYIAKNCKKVTGQKLDPGEKIEVKLMGFDSFLNLVQSSINRHWLAEMLVDIYQAKLYPKYKKTLRNLIFK